MQKAISILLSISVLFILSCNSTEDDKDSFINAYMDYLFVKEKYQELDTTKLKRELNKALAKYEYTPESFLEDWKKYSENSETFMSILDSINERTQRKIIFPELGESPLDTQK